MNNLYWRILAIDLDSTKNIDIINKLCSRLSYLKRGINITIFLYTSPECIIRNPWFALLPTLISDGVLNVVHVDEFYLFVMFGITFRKELVLMKNSFFCHPIADIYRYHQNPLDLSYNLKVSLLLTAVIFSHKLLHLIKNRNWSQAREWYME